LKFNGQLGTWLNKFKTKDKTGKGAEIWGFNWSSSGVKLNKIKSLRPIRGVIRDKSQIKGLKRNWQKKYCSSSSSERLLEGPPS